MLICVCFEADLELCQKCIKCKTIKPDAVANRSWPKDLTEFKRELEEVK